MSLYQNRNVLVGTKPAVLTTDGANITISGVNISCVTPAKTASSALTDAFADRVVVVGLALDGGAGVTLLRVSLNGIPGNIWVQSNTGGGLVVIFSAVLPFHVSERTFRFDGTLSASGVTAGRANITTLAGLSSPSPQAYGLSETAIDTTRTVTLPVWPTGYVVAVAINDVASANSCTWTGTALISENSDTTIGTYRQSKADTILPTAGAAQTVIATFAVTSVSGINLVAASWR